MKTDALFFELFSIVPGALPRLLGINPPSPYTFKSITVKNAEQRIDGYFEPLEPFAPLIFLEVQGYNDPRVYWRLLREIAMCYEQRTDDQPIMAVVLFLDATLAPPVCPITFQSPLRLLSANRVDSLKAIREGGGALNVLRPLVVETVEELRLEFGGWKKELEALELPASHRKRLIELLEYAIVQRFPPLTGAEIQAMFQLTPLEETVAGQELIQKGEARGEMIGKIQLCQKLLGLRISTRRTLAKKPNDALQTLLATLELEAMTTFRPR